jgi:hypothetical protein
VPLSKEIFLGDTLQLRWIFFLLFFFLGTKEDKLHVKREGTQIKE